MDARTTEVRHAHDTLAELYAERLAGALDRMPTDRAVLGLFCEFVLAAGLGTEVGDIGSGSGRLTRHLADRGLSPHGVDLSPEMVRVARRDHPGFLFDVADLRTLPFGDATLAGVLCWYSLMYLAPGDRPAAFAELARVVRPGGHLATAFKLGDDELRRGGRTVGVEFDIWWLSHAELTRRLTDAGFAVVFSAERPPDPDEAQPQGYLIARRTRTPTSVLRARSGSVRTADP